MNSNTLTAEQIMEEYNSCTLCPRNCKANRNNRKTGFCGETSDCRIAAALPHFGEEPCITGTNGSGTIFFSGCSCGCFFCQNYQISHDHLGNTISLNQLLQTAEQLISEGVHNLNFVTPDHFWPHVKYICTTLRKQGCTIPFLLNGSGYSKIETVKAQAKIVDIFLPDYKFADPALAKLCMGDCNYPDIALSAIEEMVNTAGFLRPFDRTGEITATRGTMVRHLVLPGQIDNSFKALENLFNHFGPLLPISIMSQFQPMPECAARGLFTSKLAPEDYLKVCDFAEDLGFTRIFTQTDLGDDSYSPDFTSQSPFAAMRKA